ncbi:BTAD domain-containing putative transcriptional regulator [Nonomuraea typhae]|uniref:BTAD domain-containing putative transcriptional regulator n=1 Tax=Nonomuraea typhae TaxID=2603600 RepID=UPI0012F7E72C|nr:BTAD domain-containing putative transcriptional regulator [Nonomuraea typhae]
MRFGVLGAVRAWRADGGEVPLGGPARRALLAALLLRPGRPVPAERLIDEVYGERPPKDAHHAIQSQVSRLRRDGIAIERAGAGYLLRVDPDDVDVHRFLRLAAEGGEALSRDDPVRAAELLREALGWWAAPAPTVHLEERHLAALEDLAEADLRRGAHDAALATLGELVERHPLRERPREQQMRALRAAGRPVEALLVYERTRRLLAEELGADPSPGLAALHQELLRGEPTITRPPAHQPLTSFVGRDEDAARVAELLSRARLVTLVGPGGVGKTRLATETIQKFPDTRLIELAHLRDGSDLPQTITSALGIRDGDLMGTTAHAEQPAARLVTALKGRDLLLVLDNCEQIVEEAAALSERLLRDCPGVRILATSREPLAITPEHLWPVRPLPLDQAVALFTDRAKAVRPGLAATPAIAAICANLDGLPLAIELAAARVRTHEPEELAARLESERFGLLSRGSRTAAERHRTLHAVVAWSWDLLTPDEQTMAARLTVFAGGATAAAARRVSGLPDAESLLDSLADKSFADVANGRYRMLATIRDFCADHLDDPATVRLAHASHYLDVATTADPHLRTGDQLTWLNALAEEHADLRRALRWTVESGAHDLGMRLLGAQAQYLWMRGLRSAAAPEARALLEHAEEEGDDYVLCALIAGDPDHLRRAAALVERGHRHPLLAFLWPLMAANLLGPGSVLTLLARAESGTDPWQRAMARLILAYPQMADARFGQAREALTGALNDFRALGDRWGAALALDALGWLAATTGDRTTALACTSEALTLAEHLGADEDHADLLCNRGDLHQLDDPAAARADYERALEVARRSGIPTYLAAAQRGLGDLARLAGNLPEARELYEKALAGTDAVWIKSAGNHARLLTGLGRLAAAEGDPAAAASAYHRAITQAVVTGAVPECARAVEALADLAPPEEAARLLGAATALRGCAVPDRGERAATTARLRAALGEETFAAAHAAGARLTRAQALALAGVPEEVVSASPLLVSGR